MPTATLEALQTPRQAPRKPVSAVPKPTQRPAGVEFPDAEFVSIENVPLFGEHTTQSTAEPGRTLKFGPAELQAVCNRCNRRIVETGDYAAVVVGHTPSPEEAAQGSPQPELIGLCGPFRMGTIGSGEKQRACILGDFHIFREELPKLRKHPRRSPELWLEEDYSEMFLDPIALLGGEAPRLDMGLLYSAWRNGRRCERYAAACAMPSASNVHALTYGAEQPSDKISPAKAKEMLANPPHGQSLTTPQEYMLQAAAHKDDYSAGTGTEPGNPKPVTSEQPKESNMALTPEDIKQFVEMFMATDVGQFLRKKMEEESGTNAIVPGESAPPEPGESTANLTPEIEAPGTAGKEHPFEGAEPPAPNAGSEMSMPPASTNEPPVASPEAPPPGAKPKEKDAMGESMPAEQYAAACSGMDKMGDKDLEKYLAGRWAKHPKHAKYAAEAFGSTMTKVPEGDGNGETDGGAKPPAGSAGGTEGEGASTIAAGSGHTTHEDDHKVASAGKEVEAYAKRFEGELTAIKQELAATRHRERYSRLREATQTRVLDLPEEMERSKNMTPAQFEDHMKVVREHYEKIPVGYYAVPDAPTDFQAEPTNAAHGQPEKYRADNVKKAEHYCETRKAQGKPVEFGEVLGLLENGQQLPV